MSNVLPRFHEVLQQYQLDRQTAATLVLAERLDLLVNAMLNVDATVTKLDENAIRNTPTTIDVSDAATRYIRDNYVPGMQTVEIPQTENETSTST